MSHSSYVGRKTDIVSEMVFGRKAGKWRRMSELID